jgi:formate dehydrogenase assembly factor FdhD
MYPKDRQHRFLIGKHKGEIRAAGMMSAFKDKRGFEKWANRRRNTTTTCSCSMCGNPRRTAWKKKDQLTMQELKLEKIDDLLFEIR